MKPGYTKYVPEDGEGMLVLSSTDLERLRTSLVGVDGGQACLVPAVVMRALLDQADHLTRLNRLAVFGSAVTVALYGWLGWQVAASIITGAIGVTAIASLLAIRKAAKKGA